MGECFKDCPEFNNLRLAFPIAQLVKYLITEGFHFVSTRSDLGIYILKV